MTLFKRVLPLARGARRWSRCRATASPSRGAELDSCGPVVVRDPDPRRGALEYDLPTTIRALTTPRMFSGAR